MQEVAIAFPSKKNVTFDNN